MTTPPGTAVGTSVAEVTVSAATVTTLAQPGSEPPTGQVVPSVGELTPVARIPLPGPEPSEPGARAVTEKVMTADAPGASAPVQVRSVPVTPTVPVVAPAFPS